MTWQKVKLGDICEIISGSTPKTSVAEYWGEGVWWATPKDLSRLDSMYLESTEKRITQAGMRSCSTRLLPVGSVLFSSRAPIGHVAINSIPVCTNQGFKSFVPNERRAHNKYLYFWLRANREYLDGLGNGATFREVSKTTVERVEIPLPPLPEQKRLAAILDRADAVRRARRESLARLDELAQSLFLDLFGDPATNPKGWDVVRLKEAVVSLNGRRVPVESSIRATKAKIYRYYGASGIIDKIDNFIFDEETLLIGEDGANLLSRNSPIAFIVSGKYWVNNHAHVLKMRENIEIFYLSFLINHIDLKPYVTGSAQPRACYALL